MRTTRVGLTLSYVEDVVSLDVRDDGIGFVPARFARPEQAVPDPGPGHCAMTSPSNRPQALLDEFCSLRADARMRLAGPE
ncbi:hypothetical protein ABZV93_18550 [Actinopolymorpha sp. NPDC004070]|uniref:hypothetical protein n=1 Tax=Actinopolymorpha sp. NPDC004070 TaxID=3154548 RepID=UPI0033A5D19A